MYNNKKFLTVFRVILLIALFESVLYFWMNYTQAGSQSRNDQYRWLYWGIYIVNIAGLWGGIAYWFKNQVAALIAALLSIGANLARIYVLRPDISFRAIDYSITKTVFDFTICLIPTLVFGWMVFRDKRAWPAMLLGALSVGTSFIDGYAISQFLGQLFGDRFYFTIRVELGGGSHRYVYYLGALFQALVLPILFLGYSFVLDGLKNNINYLKGRSVDLSHSLSKSWATVVYLVFWLSILTLTFNAGQYAGGISWYYGLLLRLFLLFTVYLLSLAFRNFLATYLISRGETPNMRYFWWVFPFTSIAAWLWSLLLIEKRVPLRKRIQVFKQQQETSDNNQPLKVLLIILVILIALYNLTALSNRISSFQILSIVGRSVISVVLIIWYLNHHSGIWPILVIAAIQIGIVSYVTTRGTATISPNFVYSLANALLMFPLFHLYHLKNVAELPPEEEVPEEEIPSESL